MLKELFQKNKEKKISKKYAVIPVKREEHEQFAPILNENQKMCKKCNNIIERENLKNNSYVCPKCNYHFRIAAKTRLDLIFDLEDTLELFTDLKTLNPLGFDQYEEKVEESQKNTGLNEAVFTGITSIEGHKVCVGIMDSNFMMGSMGSVVGEKITLLIEEAICKNLPLILFTTSGGARMQEGMLSLMQMAKTSAALSKLDEKNLPYIVVLTDPTSGGVTASFAMLGDIILAEPNALICFAGPRVIEQTIKQKLPEGFQRSEFLKEKGFVDKIVSRDKMRNTLLKILKMHGF